MLGTVTGKAHLTGGDWIIRGAVALSEIAGSDKDVRDKTSSAYHYWQIQMVSSRIALCNGE